MPVVHGLLESGQIEQGRRLRMLAAPLHVQNIDRQPLGVGQDAVGRRAILDLSAFKRPPVHRHDETPERSGPVRFDGEIALDDHVQGGGAHPS